MSVPVKIYDKNLDIVADLQNAHNVSYTKRLNEVWDGSFDLPADDDKNDLFDLLYFAELYDGDKRVGLFRINRQTPERQEDSSVIHYECKHVLDTLNDDQIIDTTKTVDGETKEHQPITKTGAQTAIEYILGEQTTTNWQLGDLDFSKNFEYEFKHQTLLRALLDVPKPWWEDYELTFDTRSHPWTINVEQPSTTPKSTLRYGKNISSIEREIDAEKLVTKLYAYGDGSGNEQVSAGPFTSNVSTYGTHVGIWEEQYFDNESDLSDAAQKYLDRVDTPRVEYRGTAADLYQLINANRIELGEYLSIYDDELGIDTTVQVVELSKNDVKGNPGELRFNLANQSQEFPNYGSLAFRDKATEDNLAGGSVGGGSGGALAEDTITPREMAENSIEFDFISFTEGDEDQYLLGSHIKVGSTVTFEENYNPLSKYDLEDDTVDSLKDGDTYAKMLADWRSQSDVTKIAGGKIFTDSVDLDRINFSPTASKNIVGQINANDNGLTIDTDVLDIVGSSSINLASDGTISLDAPNVKITSLNDDGNWGSRISANEDQISINVTDIDDNESSISINADQIQTNVSDIDGNSSQITQNADQISTNVTDIDGNESNITQNANQISTNVTDIDGNESNITQNANQISTNVTDIDGNSSQITQNANEIDIRVKEGEVMSYINVTGAGIDINADDELELISGNTITIDAQTGLELDAPQVQIGDLDATGVKERINADSEGVIIAGENIQIDGTTTFTSAYDPATQWPTDTQAPDSQQVQGETIIDGGYIDTGLLEADFAKIDTLDLTDTTLLTNAVKEGGADETIDHVTTGDYEVLSSTTNEYPLSTSTSVDINTYTEEVLTSVSAGTTTSAAVTSISVTKDADGHVTDVTTNKGFFVDDVALSTSTGYVVDSVDGGLNNQTVQVIGDIAQVTKDVLVSANS